MQQGVKEAVRGFKSGVKEAGREIVSDFSQVEGQLVDHVVNEVITELRRRGGVLVAERESRQNRSDSSTSCSRAGGRDVVDAEQEWGMALR